MNYKEIEEAAEKYAEVIKSYPYIDAYNTFDDTDLVKAYMDAALPREEKIAKCLEDYISLENRSRCIINELFENICVLYTQLDPENKLANKSILDSSEKLMKEFN